MFPRYVQRGAVKENVLVMAGGVELRLCGCAVEGAKGSVVERWREGIERVGDEGSERRRLNE